jgi:Na+/melibiose symporter-like transporter
MNSIQNSERLSLPRLIAFAAPAGSVGAIFIPMSLFLPPLYSELGIGLASVGMIFLIAKVWDGLTDPVLGVLADRYGARFGRRRPWIVASVPILAVSIHRLFIPPPDPGAVYLLVWLLVLYIGWTMLTISHVAWASELTEDYDERSRVMGGLQVLTLLGGLSVLVFAATLETGDAPGALADRVGRLGIFILVPIPLLVAMAVTSTAEVARSPGPRPRLGLRALLGQRSLLRLIAADLLIGIQIGTTTALHVFFVSQVLEMPDAASVYFVIMLVSGLLCIPGWVKLSYRIGKHRTLCAGALVGCLAAVAVSMLPAGQFGLGVAAFVTVGLYTGARELLVRSIMADVVLEDSAREGTERAATFFAMLTFTAKLGVALAVGMTFVILSIIGFTADAANTPDVLTRFRWVIGGLPFLTGTGVILLLWRFPIDAARQRELRAKLDSLRAGATT